MSPSRQRALLALQQLCEELGFADGSLQRAQRELDGDARELAVRMLRQLYFLREVAELLCHETNRQRDMEAGGRGLGGALLRLVE